MNSDDADVPWVNEVLWNVQLPDLLSFSRRAPDLIFPSGNTADGIVSIVLRDTETKKYEKTVYRDGKMQTVHKTYNQMSYIMAFIDSSDGRIRDVVRFSLHEEANKEGDVCVGFYVGYTGSNKAVFVTYVSHETNKSGVAVYDASGMQSTGLLLWQKTFGKQVFGKQSTVFAILLAPKGYTHIVAVLHLGSGCVAGYNAVGSEQWSFVEKRWRKTGTTDGWAICKQNQILILGGADWLAAFKTATGSLLWSLDNNSQFQDFRISSPLLCTEGKMFFVGSGKVYCIDTAQGQITSTMDFSGFVPKAYASWIALSQDSSLLLFHIQDRLFSCNILEETFSWSSKNSLDILYSTAAISTNLLSFFSKSEKQLYFLDIRSGNVLKKLGEDELRTGIVTASGDRIICLLRINDARADLFATTDETLVQGVWLKDPLHTCFCLCICTCPMIVVPHQRVRPISEGFDHGYVQSFHKPAIGMATKAISELKEHQEYNIFFMQRKIREPPCGLQLSTWARQITSMLFVKLPSAFFLAQSTRVRFNVDFKAFLSCLEEHIEDNTIQLIALNELVQSISESDLQSALDSLQADLARAEELLSNHTAIMLSAKDQLEELENQYEQDLTFEKIAKGVQGTCSDAHFLCKSEHECIISGHKNALDAFDSLAKILCVTKHDSMNSSTMQMQVNELQAKHFTQLEGFLEDDIPQLDYVLQQQEEDDIGMVKAHLSTSLEHAIQYKSLLTSLEASLEKSSGDLQTFLDGVNKIKESSAALKTKTNAMLCSREKVLASAKLKIEEAKPCKLQAGSIRRVCKAHVEESKLIAEYLRENLDAQRHASNILWPRLKSLHQSLMEAHSIRILAGNLGALTTSDLRMMLTKQGLTECADVFEEKGFKGTTFSSFLDGKRPDHFPLELDDMLEGVIQDLVKRKRAVHVIELAHLGMNIGQHTEQAGYGSQEDPCCRWSTERVQIELEKAGYSNLSPGLSKVNGEVLLLLTQSNFMELGVTSQATQQR